MFSFMTSDSVIMVSLFLYSFSLNSDQLLEMSFPRSSGSKLVLIISANAKHNYTM